MLPALSVAQAPEFEPISAGARMDVIEQRLTEDGLTQRTLSLLRDEIESFNVQATACVDRTTPQLERLKSQQEIFANLGPEADAALWDQSVEIRNQTAQTQARLSSCLSARDQSLALLETIAERASQISSRFLWERNRSLPTLLLRSPERVAAWRERLSRTVELRVEPPLTPTRLLWLLVISGAIAVGIGLFIRHRFRQWFELSGYNKKVPGLGVLLPKPLAEHGPLLLMGGTLSVVLALSIRGAGIDLLAIRVSVAILLYGVGCIVIDWATGPLSPAAQVPGLFPRHVQPLRRRLRVFVISLVASFVALGPAWLAADQTQTADTLLKAGLNLFVCITLLIVIHYMGRIPGLLRYRWLRRIGMLTIVVAIMAILLGYHNFASYLTHGAVRTLSALIVLWILLWLVFSSFEQMIEGKTPTAQRIREALGIRESDSRTGFGIMQLVADVILWIGLIVYLIYVWDSSGNTLDRLSYLVMQGDTIAGIELKPGQIIFGILVFAALLVVTGWIKRWIDKRWLRHMNMDRGARDALVTLFGYIGVILAVLIGLNVGGIDLSGLAIVGAALGLGIGFGLQAIASNFVSGLILLFERPIKAGDFVTVGDTEGFVRRIRIRATDIETLDNQNVLVPNSELVSGRVTNWVLRNPQGRLRITVGVAYGSDVELVRNILEKIANEHQEVITDGRAPAPRALFMGFGDSSLDFELRVRIRRIERRYTVISDINFAIDAAFREANITIPFPQRDLHIIDVPGTTAEAPAVPAAAKSAKSEWKTERSPDDITREHRHEVKFKCEIERVWTAITDNEWLVRWFAREADVTPRIGGQFKAVLHDDREVNGIVDIFMPPRRLRIAQQSPDGEGPLPSGPITEDITLHETRNGVMMRVVVGGIPASEDWEGFYRRSEEHWDASLEELRKLLKLATID